MKNEKDPEYGEINENEDIINKKFPKLIEKSCFDVTSYPSKLLDWFKFKFPSIIFTIFMLFETLNFATDCSQLATVLQNKKYYAYPFQKTSYSYYPTFLINYGVIWTMIKDPNYATPLLAFQKKWYGYCYNTNQYYPYDDDCLAWEPYSTTYVTKFVYTKSDYEMQDICISVQDVFSNDFFNHVKENKIICPNNKTAVFDANSYVKTNPYKSLGVYDYQSKQLDATSYYKKGWQNKIKSSRNCEALQNIYIGTIVIFTFECLLILCQAFTSFFNLRKREHEDSTQRYRRIESIVEFPLVGFLLMHILLTKEEIQAYYVIDKRQSVDNDVILRLTGAHRSDNIMYVPLKLNSIIYPCCCRGRDDLPATVTFAQALLYPMILPYKKNFWAVMFPADSTVCTYLLFGPISCICLCFSMFYFFLNIAFFFVIIVTYADKLYIGRFLSDIPNFSMSISYIVNVEYNNTSALSAAVSLFLTSYYIWSMLLRSITECRTRDEAKVNSTFHEVYGKLTRGQAFCLIAMQPFIMFCCYLFWIPMVFCGCSCFVEKNPESINAKISADDTKYEMIQVSSEVPVVVNSEQDKSIEEVQYTRTTVDETSRATRTVPVVVTAEEDNSIKVVDLSIETS